jgi:hypothetical protein
LWRTRDSSLNPPNPLKIIPSTAQSLEFVLAKYTLEGQFLGEQTLTSELQLCASFGGAKFPEGSAAGAKDAMLEQYKSNYKQSPWTQFATTTYQSCEILEDALIQYCTSDTILYDLFVKNTNGAKVPVPIRIINLKRSRGTPNINKSVDDRSGDFLVRRFFMCDAVIGEGVEYLEIDDCDAVIGEGVEFYLHVSIYISL